MARVWLLQELRGKGIMENMWGKELEYERT